MAPRMTPVPTGDAEPPPIPAEVRYTIIGLRDIMPERVMQMMRRDPRIQAFDARLVFGREHLESAVEHALRAFEQGRNTCRDLRTEIVLYASGERQISTAISKLGVRPDTAAVALILIDPGVDDVERIVGELRSTRDDGVLSPDGKDLAAFGIDEKVSLLAGEMAYDLVLERVALVDLWKRR